MPVAGVPQETAGGVCADGWFLCGKEGGDVEGCCPSGYGCGTVSCTRTGGGAEVTGKVLPGGAGGSGVGRVTGGGWGWAGVVMGVVGGLVL